MRVTIETIGKAALFGLVLALGCEAKASSVELKRSDIEKDFIFAVDYARSTKDYGNLVEMTEGLPCDERIRLMGVGVNYLAAIAPKETQGIDLLKGARKELQVSCGVSR